MVLKNYKRLASLTTVYSLGLISENILNFIFLPLYTLFLLPEHFGIVALLTVTSEFIIRFVVTPKTALTRFYYAPEFESNRKKLVFNLYSVLFVKVVIASLIFLALNNTLAIHLLKDESLISLVRWFTLFLMFSPLANFGKTLVRMQEKAKLYVGVSLSSLVVRASTIISLLVWYDMGVYALVIGQAAGVFIETLFTLPLLLKNFTWEFDLKMLKNPFKYAYPLIFVAFSNILIQGGDRYVIQFFGTLHEVGLYSFGYSIAGILGTIIISPLKQAMNPVILKLEKTPDKLRHFTKKCATYYYLLSTFLCLGLALFVGEVLFIMAQNKEFLESRSIIPLVAFSYVLLGLSNFASWGITMKKKSYHQSMLIIIAAVVNLGLNILLVPTYGIIGAAVATLASYAVWNIQAMYYSKKFYGLTFETKRLIFITIAFGLLYGISLPLLNTIFDLVLRLTLKTVLLLFYPLVFLLFPFFTEEESKLLQKLRTLARSKGLKNAFKTLIKSF